MAGAAFEIVLAILVVLIFIGLVGPLLVKLYNWYIDQINDIFRKGE